MSNIDLKDAGARLDDSSEPGSLASLGADEQDIILTAEGLERKRRSGPLILIGVVVLAAGSLFSMKTLTKVGASSGRSEFDRVVERYLKQPEGAPGQLAEEVLTQLPDVTPAERPLQRDIFVSSGGEAVPVTAAPANNEEHWQDQCQRAAARIKVTTVMRDLLANLNGKIVQMGGTLNSDGIEFKVIEITNEGVTLEAHHPESPWRYETVVNVRRGF